MAEKITPRDQSFHIVDFDYAPLYAIIFNTDIDL